MDNMRIVVLILFLTMLCPPGGCHAANPAPSDQLKVNSDGTATVTGTVLENSHACEVDARCFLRLRVADAEVVVVYGPAEGEKAPHVRDTRQEWNMKIGEHVEAYGRFQKENFIEVYSSEAFYVHVLNQ